MSTASPPPMGPDRALRYLTGILRYTWSEAVDAVNGAGAAENSTYQLARHQVRWDYPGVYFVTEAPDPRLRDSAGRLLPRKAGGVLSKADAMTALADLAWIRQVIETVDAHLDADTAPAYRDQPLAGDMSRIGKAQSEAREAMEALAGVTGENPRKGICDTWEHVLEELGDTACAALLGIQHKTKDASATWAVFLAALAKAYGRVPDGERPGPAAPICGTCGTRCGGGGACPGPVTVWKGRREDEPEEGR